MFAPPCNLLSLFWITSSFLVLISHFLKNFDSKLKELYLFGKLKNRDTKSETKQAQRDLNRDKPHLILQVIRLISSVPKRYFMHFYALGLICHSSVIASLFAYNHGGIPIINKLFGILNVFCESENSTQDDSNMIPVVLVLCMEWVQICRRLYECLFVSSFSSGTMSIIHYFFGLFLYSSYGIGLLSSEHFGTLKFPSFLPTQEAVIYGLCILVFVLASVFQHKSMKTFAALRTANTKDKPTAGHFIPRGHLFEMVSCPHYLCEILIYLSQCWLFSFRNSYLLALTLFVVTNQACSALLTHDWYRTTFRHYPQHRKAIIPFLF